jgi:hypothetical protein
MSDLIRCYQALPCLASSSPPHALCGAMVADHANLCQHAAAKRMVQQLVQLDRLPKENTIEGLLLLRSAWRDYDVAKLLAGRYKLICKVTYLMQLLLGWAAVALSSFTPSGNDSEATGSTLGFGQLSVHVVFGISVSMTLLVATDSILNSHSRWRHLRVGAGTLESIVWKYRTRTGIFGIDEKDERDPVRLRTGIPIVAPLSIALAIS